MTLLDLSADPTKGLIPVIQQNRPEMVRSHVDKYVVIHINAGIRAIQKASANIRLIDGCSGSGVRLHHAAGYSPLRFGVPAAADAKPDLMIR
jgi:hypothetical protein